MPYGFGCADFGMVIIIAVFTRAASRCCQPRQRNI
jgi:hypothetical protein